MALRLLVVDDNDVARMLLSDMAKLIGHQVVAEACDLQSAVAAYLEHKPDLVTLDLSMPGADGLTVLRELRKIDENAKVLIISSFREQAVYDGLARAGASGYLMKPITLDAFKLRLTELTGH